MKRFAWWPLAMAAVLCLLAVAAGLGEAEAQRQAPSASASLPALEALRGSYVVAPLHVDECAGIAGIQVELTFDPGILACTGVAKGPLLGSDWILIGPTIDNGAGTVTFLAFQVSAQPLPPGQGDMFTISFYVWGYAPQGGASPLHFEELLVSDPYGQPIAVAPVDGQVTVIQTWFEDDDPAIVYTGTWLPVSNPAASAGHLKCSSERAARADFSFYGTGIGWQVAMGPMMGKARVYLDGAAMTLDLYRPTTTITRVAKAGLTQGPHTVTILVLGLKNPSATGYYVTLDALEVTP